MLSQSWHHQTTQKQTSVITQTSKRYLSPLIYNTMLQPKFRFMQKPHACACWNPTLLCLQVPRVRRLYHSVFLCLRIDTPVRTSGLSLSQRILSVQGYLSQSEPAVAGLWHSNGKSYKSYQGDPSMTSGIFWSFLTTLQIATQLGNKNGDNLTIR